MPTTTLSAQPAGRDQDRACRLVIESPRSELPSDLFIAANREWFPGLRALSPDPASRVLPKFVPRPTAAPKPLPGREGPEAAVDPSTLRAAMANREWFPGLCRTCMKREGCVFPIPEGGVFSCEEFE